MQPLRSAPGLARRDPPCPKKSNKILFISLQMSYCQYLDVNLKPICEKRLFYGGHHCRHCKKFICNDHTEGKGDRKFCRNKTCYTPEEVAALSIENMSKLGRESKRFHTKPLFDEESDKVKKSSQATTSNSQIQTPDKRIQLARFLFFVGITTIILQIYFPERIQKLDILLQRSIDSIENLVKPYNLDFYLYYVFLVSRIVYIWTFLFLVITYAFFKTL